MSAYRPHPAASVLTLAAVALLASATAAFALAWRQSDEPSTAAADGDNRGEADVPAKQEPSQTERPSVRESDGDESQGERRNGPRREGRRDRPGYDRRNAGPPDEKEWRDASESMKTLAPNASAHFLEMRESAPFRPAFQRRIVDRHQELERLKEHHPKQYASEVRQIQVEDDIFGLATKLRGADPTTTDRTKAEIRRKIEELVDLRIANRELRVKRLAEQLERDKKDKSAIVQRKYDDILRRAGTNGRHFANPGLRPGGKRGRPPQQPAPNAPTPPVEQSPNDDGGEPSPD